MLFSRGLLRGKYPGRRTAEIATVWAGGTGNAQKVEPSTRMNFRLTLAIVYYRVSAESFGAAGAIGSILKGISKGTDCGILQI